MRTSHAQLLQTLVDSTPYASYLGIVADLNNKNESIFRLAFQEHHLGNPMIRTFHGGIIASFAEIAAAIDTQANQKLEKLPKCSSITLDYLRPAFAGTLLAKPSTVRVGKRFTVVSVDVQLEQKLVSRGRFIYTPK